jgi:hypothetical protein
MKKTLVGLFAAVLIFQGAAFGSNSSAGTSTAQFLKLGAGARAAGMGDAYVGVSDDASAVYWNPAGLAGLTSKEVSFNQAFWFDNITYQFVSGILPTEIGTFGIGLQYLSYGAIPGMTNTGVSTGDFSPYDLMAGVSYGRMFGDLDAGATLKYISSKINNTASAEAVDLGARYRFFGGKLTTGLMVQNLGTKMKFVSAEDPLPLNVRLGGSYNFGDDWLAALDLNQPNDDNLYACVGGEKKFMMGGDMQIAGRVGYTTLTKDATGTKGISVGVGFGYKQLMLDASFAPYSDLGDTTKITFGAKF